MLSQFSIQTLLYIPISSCIYTTHPEEPSPWWKTDLLDKYRITAVTVYSRTECQECLNDVEIRIGDHDHIEKNELCHKLLQWPVYKTCQTFQCNPPIEGRFVLIQRKGVSGHLSFCEVAIYGVQAEDVGKELSISDRELASEKHKNEHEFDKKTSYYHGNDLNIHDMCINTYQESHVDVDP